MAGAFVQTPAPLRFQSAQTGEQQKQMVARSQASFDRRQVGFQTTNAAQQQSSQLVAQPQAAQPQPQAPALAPVQRAARTINESLQRDASFPDLDSYVRRECSLPQV